MELDSSQPHKWKYDVPSTLLTSTGRLAVPGDMTPPKTIEAPAACLKDLLAVERVSHRGTTCGRMRLLTVAALRISLSLL